MKYPFTLDLTQKPEGYMEAVEAWLQETPVQVYCELDVPRKRMFMGMEAWFRRYNSVEMSRVCAMIVNPVLNKDTMTFSGDLVSYGLKGDVVEKMHGLVALSARMIRETASRRVVKIYSFDVTQ